MRARYLALLTLTLAAAPAAAQDTTGTVVQLRTTYDTRDLSGFVVLPFSGGGDAAAAAAAGEVVLRDLDFSDRFQMREAGAEP
jgi:hypothetical protein